MTAPTVPVCSCCGQLIAPDVSLPPIKQRIFDAVRRRPGIGSEDLRSVVWNGPDGGPENRKVVHVHINQLNRLLVPFGLRVRGSRSHGYHVQAIEARRQP
jgi:hypothetical protein